MPGPGTVPFFQPQAFTAGLAAVLAGALLWLGLAQSSALAQAPSQPASPAAPASVPAASPVPAPAASAAANRAASSKSTAAALKSNNRHVTKPLWSELAPAQQQALAPLAGKWDTVSDAQKRKWLALSKNFPRMSQAEQDKLHSRMSEWAALSPQQRTEARLNFGETKKLSPDDKKAKWEAYQALPAEEKRKLAASAPKPPATAAALRPVAREKMADVPKPKRVSQTPRIAAEPGQVDHNTLLPQPSPALGAAQAN